MLVIIALVLGVVSAEGSYQLIISKYTTLPHCAHPATQELVETCQALSAQAHGHILDISILTGVGVFVVVLGFGKRRSGN
ncbi:MAG TPA: hypothetical protein VMT30_04690 [Candidatus Saccharimonadia bacterium]|nr:hypothetical protein [Candidatus Saccharimonadia bacterium]